MAVIGSIKSMNLTKARVDDSVPSDISPTPAGEAAVWPPSDLIKILITIPR